MSSEDVGLTPPVPTTDTERCLLRNFVKTLAELGECEARDEPIE